MDSLFLAGFCPVVGGNLDLMPTAHLPATITDPSGNDTYLLTFVVGGGGRGMFATSLTFTYPYTYTIKLNGDLSMYPPGNNEFKIEFPSWSTITQFDIQGGNLISCPFFGIFTMYTPGDELKIEVLSSTAFKAYLNTTYLGGSSGLLTLTPPHLDIRHVGTPTFNAQSFVVSCAN
jgi:hypothetical protein